MAIRGLADGHLPYLTKEELGYYTIKPAGDVIAGSYGTWTLTYTVGKYGVDVGGGIKIGTRRMSDWGEPQFTNPTAPNYVTAKCSVPDAIIDISFSLRGHIRTYRAVTIVDLKKKTLKQGDQLTVVFGDNSKGSPGIRVQSFPETECEFAVFVDCVSSGAYERVPQLGNPFRVITGEPVTYSIQAPSTVIAGKPFKVMVNGIDVLGNPTPSNIDNIEIDTVPPIKLSLKKEDGRTKWIDGAVISSTGVSYLKLKQGGKVLAVSNPINVNKSEGLNLYWGDTQAQTSSTVGTGSVEEYYDYAKNVARLDFCTHQANDFMVSREAWDEIYAGGIKYNKPGEFLTFIGFEWSGTSPAGGDRNVLFTGDEAIVRRSSSWQLCEPIPEEEAPTANDLHRELHKFEDAGNKKVVLVPHVGGRRANWDYYDPSFEQVLEICSCHGIFEWFLHDALERGYKIGVVGASDDHTCRPGLAPPSNKEMAIYGGLGGIYAKELTRSSIAEAILARRCFATTGKKISVWTEADGNPMGSSFSSKNAPTFKVKAYGTAPIKEISIFDGKKEIDRRVINKHNRIKNKLRITWQGAVGNDRNRYTTWDGDLELSKGKILSVQTLNMFATREKITKQEERKICWDSITAGHEVGIIVDIDAPDDTQITFKTKPASFTFTLKDLFEKDMHVDAGGVFQCVDVTTLHSEESVTTAEFEFKDTNFDSKNNHAYYIRMTQTDLHRAWSSPIFVEKIK